MPPLRAPNDVAVAAVVAVFASSTVWGDDDADNESAFTSSLGGDEELFAAVLLTSLLGSDWSDFEGDSCLTTTAVVMLSEEFVSSLMSVTRSLTSRLSFSDLTLGDSERNPISIQ